MTNEKILKLLKSSSPEDVIIGMNFLNKWPIHRIRLFLNKHGKKYDAVRWECYSDIVNTNGPQCYILRRKYVLVWNSRNIWVLESVEYKDSLKRWVNQKI